MKKKNFFKKLGIFLITLSILFTFFVIKNKKVNAYSNGSSYVVEIALNSYENWEYNNGRTFNVNAFNVNGTLYNRIVYSQDNDLIYYQFVNHNDNVVNSLVVASANTTNNTMSIVNPNYKFLSWSTVEERQQALNIIGTLVNDLYRYYSGYFYLNDIFNNWTYTNNVLYFNFSTTKNIIYVDDNYTQYVNAFKGIARSFTYVEGSNNTIRNSQVISLISLNDVYVPIMEYFYDSEEILYINNYERLTNFYISSDLIQEDTFNNLSNIVVFERLSSVPLPNTDMPELIFAIGEAPLTIIKGLLSPTIFGMNLFLVFGSILTIVVLVWLIKKFI